MVMICDYIMGNKIKIGWEGDCR